MAYLTTSIVKSDWLRIESADTSMDALIGRMIAAAEDEIENLLNQPVEQQSIAIYWDGLGETEHALLYTVPVTSTTLKYREDPTIAWTTVDAADYAVRARHFGKSLWYKNGFTPYVEYEYTASVGYAAGTIPADILVAGYELVKELYYETPYAGQSERFGVSAVTEGQGGTTFSKAIARMRPYLIEKLAPYRLQVI